jgi:hypothetical protein
MLKRIQTSTLKLFGDHANGLLLQRKLDLIPLSKTPILNLHQPLLSQEQLDFNLDKFYQVFTTVVKAFLTWKPVETLFTPQEPILLELNSILICPITPLNPKLLSKTNKQITPGN